MHLFIKKCINYYNEITKISRKPVVSVLPGHLSFFLLLSSIPIILLMGIITNFFSISFSKLVDFIILSLPANTSDLVVPLFDSTTAGISIFLLFVSAIYLASRGTKAIINTANSIYEVQRKNVQDIVKSIFLTLILVLLFIFLIIILILGEKILYFILSISHNSFLNDNLIRLVGILKWPISFILIFYVFKIIYLLSPNKKISKKSVNKGSLFTTILILIVTFLYSFYVTNYASYNDYYGGAANIIILMLWIYLVSKIFVYGMIINSIEEKKNKEHKELKNV